MKRREAGFARSSVVLLIGALALLGGLAWWLLRDERPGGGGPRVEAPRVDTPAPLAPVAEAEGITPTRELAPTPVVPVVAVADELDARPAPESFTRELSGLHGRLVEADGTPVPNLKVELLQLELDLVMASFEGGFADPPKRFTEPIVATTKARADGVFELHGVQSTPVMVLGIDLGGGRATAQLVDASFTRGATVDLGDIVLPPHVTFTGKLENAEGAPLAGARIRVLPQLPWPIPPQALQVGVQDIRSDSAALVAVDPVRTVMAMPAPLRFLFDRLPLPTTRTEADGTFRVAGIPAGLVTVLADHPGQLGLVRGPIPTGRRAEQDIGTLRLPEGRTVSGRVVAGEQPLTGARLYVGATLPIGQIFGVGEDGMLAIGQPTAPTAADGTFSLGGLPENGDVVCALQRQAGDPWQLFGPYPAGAPITLELPPATTLNVAIQDGKQQPVRGAELRFVEVTPANELPFLFKPAELKGRVTEVEPGRYVVRELPIGEWRVLARAPGYGIGAEQVTLPAEGATMMLTLGGAVSLAVQVIDAAAQPIDYALVTALGTFQSAHVMPFTAARTDPEGKATLSALPIDSPLALRVVHPGYARGYVKISSEQLLANAPVVVALARGGDLVGRVQTQGAPPPKPLMLLLESRDDVDNVPESEFPHFGLTQADGSFAVRHLTPGRWRYMVFTRFLSAGPLDLVKRIAADNEPEPLAEGEFEIAEGQETTLEIEALPDVPMVPARLFGEVRVAGERIAGAQIQVAGRRWENAESDAQGAFAIESLRPGRYTVTVHRMNEHGRSLIHQEQMVLGSGEQRELRVDAQMSAFPVVVLQPDGAPAEGATLSTHIQSEGDDQSSTISFGGGGTRTDEQGRATLELLPKRFFLIASHQEFGRTKVEIDAARPPAEPLVVTLQAGVHIAGRVEVAGWRPDPNAEREEIQLYLSPIEGDDIHDEGFDRWFQLDAEKLTFELKNGVGGRWRAMLWISNSGSMRQLEFDVPPAGASDLVLRFESN